MTATWKDIGEMIELGEATVFDLYHKVPRSEWGDYLLGKSESDLHKIEMFAEMMAVICSEISTYVGMRGGDGCGDHGHEKAIEKARKTRKKVRKALGYTYP